MNHNQIIFSGLLIVSWALAGCKEQKQSASTQPNPRSPTMTDVSRRAPEMRTRAAEFTAAAKALPGSNDSKDRRLSEAAFERATAVLTLLAGPRPNGGFRQDQRIIEMIRQQLRTAPAGMAMDPAVDTGLRAIYNSLVNLRERWFPVDRSVGAQLDTLRDRVADLDSVRGPLHSVAAADCFVAAAALTETMAAQLEGRIMSNSDAAATQPSP